jgi:hypothetical protein
MSGINIIPAQRVQMIAPAAPTVIHDEAEGEPRITLIKDGDAVRTIEIACTCGQVIRLDCAYASPLEPR